MEINERDGDIDIVGVSASVDLVETNEGLVAIPRDALPPLTDDELFATVERLRR
ncbi:MAG: hypothetical protein JJE52_17690 [Acidimicrobiia bacterium]|nr:hypothetical protein [Acidimicrobiia bacterium]